MSRKSPGRGRNNAPTPGVSRRMKRDSSSLLALTVRTAITVALALILILVLLPAVLAAQAAGLR